MMLFFIHLAAVKSFKGAAVDFKGFIAVYGFISVPLLLMAIPIGIGGLIGGIWMLVLFFLMMKAVFGHGFGKTLLVVICGGLVGAIIGGIVGSLIGLGGYNSGFSSSSDFEFDLGDVE